MKGTYRWETNHLLLSGCERKNQKISIDKNNILFYSIIIEAKPFSIPAAASGTKASPKSKVRIKCYGKYDKCIKSALYKLHRNILTSYFEHLTRSASLLFSFEVKYFLTLKRMIGSGLSVKGAGLWMKNCKKILEIWIIALIWPGSSSQAATAGFLKIANL